MPPIMANFEDNHGQNDKYIDTSRSCQRSRSQVKKNVEMMEKSCHKEFSCENTKALSLTVEKLYTRLKFVSKN